MNSGAILLPQDEAEDRPRVRRNVFRSFPFKPAFTFTPAQAIPDDCRILRYHVPCPGTVFFREERQTNTSDYIAGGLLLKILIPQHQDRGRNIRITRPKQYHVDRHLGAQRWWRGKTTGLDGA